MFFFLVSFCPRIGSIRIGRAHAHTERVRAKMFPRGNKNRHKSNALRMDSGRLSEPRQRRAEREGKNKIKAEENNGHSVMCPLGRVPNIITSSYCFQTFNLILFRCRQPAVDDDSVDGNDGDNGAALIIIIISTAGAYYNNALHMVS